MTIANPIKDRLERQGHRVILRAIQPVIYGSDQVSYIPIRLGNQPV